MSENKDNKPDSGSLRCSVADIYAALDQVGEQIVRAQAILKSWPHAQYEKANVETEIGTLRYERPYLIVVDADGNVTRSTELSALWRIKVAASIPQLIKVCESIMDEFLSETEKTRDVLSSCLDGVE